MRMSRDHILTSQAGSLPRPDDLISANSAREAGETDRRSGVRTDAASCRRRRCAQAKGNRHRRARRWRVWQVDGPQNQLSRLVELLLQSARRARFDRAGSLRRRAEAGQTRRSRAHKLCRPARSHKVPAGLHRSGRQRVHRTGHGQMAGMYRSGGLQGTRRDQGRHCPYEGGAESERRRRGLYDLGRAGERLAACQRLLQDRRRVHVRGRRGDARGIQGDRRCRPDPATR